MSVFNVVISFLHKIRGKTDILLSQIVLRLIKDYVAFDEWYDHELATIQLNSHLLQIFAQNHFGLSCDLFRYPYSGTVDKRTCQIQNA
jgi:hypothetical protein